jgi:hypothetical protein
MYRGHLELITNRQTWSDTFTCLTDEGVPLDVSAASFEIFVRNPKTRNIDLRGSTADGHFTLPNGGTDGVVVWTFSATDVHALAIDCATLTYDVALYITLAGVVTPLALVSLPVHDGIKP